MGNLTTPLPTYDAPVGDPALAPLRALGLGLLVLAGALVANTIAGPLGAGWIDYPISRSMENQLVGLELVTMLLVVPTLVVAGVMARRGRHLAPLVGIGPSGYAAYMFIQYAVGPQYAHYSPAPLLHVAVAGLGALLTVWCWRRAAELELPRSSGRQHRRRAAWLVVLGGFVLLRYLPVFAGAVAGTAIPSEFADSPGFFWSIVLLDLGGVVPVAVLAAVACVRGWPAADHAYYAVIGWFTLVPPSVAAMAVVMLVRDDPHASLPTAALLTVASAAFAWPAIRALRQLRRGPVGDRRLS